MLYNRVSTFEKPEHSKIFLFLSLSSPSLPDLSLLSSFSLFSFFPFFLSSSISFLSSGQQLLRRAPTHQVSGPARDAPRRADQARRTRRDPGRPTGTSPVQARQLRNLSWTASARAVLFAATPFRRRFPRLHTLTCSRCRCRHARAFGIRFRGP